jgi:hypothetical protein
VLQRNVSGSPLVLPTLDPPAQVLPGDTIEWDEPLAGFEKAKPEYDPAETVMDIRVTEQSTKDDKKAAPSATTDEEATK